MVFHLGVLKALAEQSKLENVQQISSVSGGSLLIGLIFQQAQWQWPSSTQFLHDILPTLHAKLCQRSLQWGAARQLIDPRHWRFLLSRSNLLALALEKEWQIQGTLADLPDSPIWAINGTTAETGKRFGLTKHQVGDYTLGYADAQHFSLSQAMAISAAIPGGFGPLTLDTTRISWRSGSWQAEHFMRSSKPIALPYDRIRLYDGGVYDNLGLEPFFDVGTGLPRHENVFVLVSDASALLPKGFNARALNPFRLMRVMDILCTQTRSLRVRPFMNYLQRNPHGGAYIYLGSMPFSENTQQTTQRLKNLPTTLQRIPHADAEVMIQGAAQLTHRRIHQ